MIIWRVATSWADPAVEIRPGGQFKARTETLKLCFCSLGFFKIPQFRILLQPAVMIVMF